MKLLVLVLILLISGGVLAVGFAGHLEKIGCGFLSGNTKDHCYQDAAVRLSSPAVCFMVTGEDWGNVIGNPPQAKCLRMIAVKEKNPAICYKIVEGHPNAETQSECFYEVAVATGNAAFCDYIQQNISRGFGMFVTTKESCYQKVGSMPVYCQGVEGAELSKCFTKIASQYRNLAFCERIVSKEDQKTCMMEAMTEIYSAQALNQDSCDGLNDVALKYNCILMTSSLLEEPQMCNEILESNWKQVCLVMSDLSAKEFGENYTEADLQQYVNKCSLFTGKGKASCLVLLGSELGSIAENSEDAAVKERISKDAIEIMLQGCTEIENDDSFAPICIVYAGNMLKTEYCTSYEGKVRDACYTIAAIDTGDCSKIIDSEAKNECKENAIPAYNIQKDKCNSYTDKAECSRLFKFWIALKLNDVPLPEDLEKIFGA